jgi:hypothetical protein
MEEEKRPEAFDLFASNEGKDLIALAQKMKVPFIGITSIYPVEKEYDDDIQNNKFGTLMAGAATSTIMIALAQLLKEVSDRTNDNVLNILGRVGRIATSETTEKDQKIN